MRDAVSKSDSCTKESKTAVSVRGLAGPRLDRRGSGARLLAAAMALSLILCAGVDARGEGRTKKRPIPDYDRRPAPAATAGDVALWVPRAVLFIPWVGYEYLIRRPIGWTVSRLERSRTGRRIFRTIFPARKGTGPLVVPIGYYDFGFQPSVGLRLLWESAFIGPGSGISVKLATWGRDWLRADFQEKIPVGAHARLVLDAEGLRRPDYVFYGLGPRAPGSAKGRYRSDRVESALTLDWRPWASSHLGLFGGLRQRSFADSSCCGASVEDRVASGLIDELPPGYARGYGLARTGIRLAFDPRPRGRGSGSAVLARVELEHDLGLGDAGSRWWKWSASVGGVLHLDDVNEKVVALSLRAEFADPVGDTEIPFTELAHLGGSRNLRGFPSGRLADRSAASATVQYRWPLAAWLDSTVYVGAGNVFGAHLSGFRPELLRGSFGLGLSLAGLSRRRSVQLWSAIGTEPWDEGFSVDSFRLVLGWAHAP